MGCSFFNACFNRTVIVMKKPRTENVIASQ